MRDTRFLIFLGIILVACNSSEKKAETILVDTLKTDEVITKNDVVALSQNQRRTPTNINSTNNCKILGGKIFTYLPRPNKKVHLFTLKFECVQDTLKGIIFGPSPQGEHGLAFYKSELKDLIISDSSNVSFVVIPGALYEQQITLENYEQVLQSFGVDRGKQFFKGKFLADTLVGLRCSSEFYDCYTDEPMDFILGK